MDVAVKGLVIGETRLNDNKKYIKILTHELGLVSVIIHGGSSVKSKHLAAIGAFTYSSFVLSERRGVYTLKESSQIKSFFALGTDPKMLALASYIVSAVGYVSTQGEETDGLLSLALNSLYALCESKKDERIVKAAFELKCASIIGFAPALIACSKCGCDISKSGAYIHIFDGNVVCADCRASEKTADYEVTRKLSPTVIAAMRYIEYCDTKKLFSFSLPDDELECLGDICESFFGAHTETTFPALGVYKSLK